MISLYKLSNFISYITSIVLSLTVIYSSSLHAQIFTHFPITQSSSIIVDNDDHRDVYTEEYLMALSDLGEINLVGMITTYAPNKKEYDLFVKGREKLRLLAEESGMSNIPQVLAGTHLRLEEPPSRIIKDTPIMDLPASKFIVEKAHRAHPDRPLVIVTGGQLTVIANAYLMDSTIADRMIISGVFGVSKQDYNAGLDSWAWKIVLSKFRVFAVPIGPSSNRGTVYMKPPKVPKQQIHSQLPLNIPFFQWMYEKHHPSNALPDGHDYDGQAAIPLTQPQYITQAQRWKVTGLDQNGQLILIHDPKGPIIEALDADQSIATREFWRVMDALALSLK